MGLDVNRFHGAVDEELICPICSGVLDKPMAAPKCEHAFCEECITKWLDRQPTCPVDRQQIQPGQLQPVRETRKKESEDVNETPATPKKHHMDDKDGR